MKSRFTLTAAALVVGTTTALGQLAPDFHLTDMNPNSLRTGQIVSPSNYLQQISGYYFGAAC